MKTELQLQAEDIRSNERLADRPHSTRPRLLIADDSPQIRESLSKLLRRAGYDVAIVAHGGHVLDRMFHEHFDVLLLDLNMPGIDGWETLERLAVFKPDLPVIIITAQPGQHEWAQVEGARALIEKPLDIPVLLQTIEKLLSGGVANEPEVPAENVEKFRFVSPRDREAFRFDLNSQSNHSTKEPL